MTTLKELLEARKLQKNREKDIAPKLTPIATEKKSLKEILAEKLQKPAPAVNTAVLNKEEVKTSMNEKAKEKREAKNNGMSYADIYDSVLLNEEIVITLPTDIVERVKIGLRNHKARHLAKLKEADIQPDSTRLVFHTAPSPTVENAIDLTIILKETVTVPILKLTIPDSTF